jgi:putative endonuclease
MSASSKALGAQGELMASLYLEEAGYTILDCNYRYKRNEIDIIATHQDTLVFVEVKTRSGLSFGYPHEAVSKKKVAAILAVAHEYILRRNWQGDIRFDIITILLGNHKKKLEHIKDAFY